MLLESTYGCPKADLLVEQFQIYFLGFFILGSGLEFLSEQLSEWLYPP